MNKKINAIFIFFCVAIVSGCTTYNYNGRNYVSAQKTLDVQQVDLDNTLRQIVPLSNPIADKALVVLPSRSLIEKNGVVTTGYMARDGIELVISSLENNYKTMADSVRARNIFNEVVIRSDDKPETYVLPGYYAIIYFALFSKNEAQWFIKFPQQNKEVPVYVDFSRQIGIDRTKAWLDIIEKNVRENLISNDKK